MDNVDNTEPRKKRAKDRNKPKPRRFLSRLRVYLSDLNDDRAEAGVRRYSRAALGEAIGRGKSTFANIGVGRESPNHRVIQDIVKFWPGTREQKLLMMEDLLYSACLDTGKITIEFPQPHSLETTKRIKEIARDAALVYMEQIP